MKEDIHVSDSEMHYIDSRMGVVEDIMKNSLKYANAEKNVKQTIDELCERFPMHSKKIQDKFGMMCAQYGLDWFPNEGNN